MAQIILISAMRCNFNKEIRMEKMNVKPATGKLGVLCVGLGAVTSTFMTGVLMARKGLAKPVGSMIKCVLAVERIKSICIMVKLFHWQT